MTASSALPKTLHLGIDPGKHGAVAIVEMTDQIIRTPADAGATFFRLVSLVDMPLTADGKRIDAGALFRTLRALDVYADTAAVELVHASPQMGRSSAFSFGAAYGVAVTLAAAFSPRLIDLPPQAWRALVKVASGAERKANSRVRAQELFVGWAAHFARVKDDGRAEAALIAVAGALQYRQTRRNTLTIANQETEA